MRGAGFTLLEALTGLAVIGVATTVALSCFGAAYQQAEKNRRMKVAVVLAEECFTDFQLNAAKYAWPALSSMETGAQVALEFRDPQALPMPARVEPPAAMPVVKRAHDAEQSFYEGFEWQVFLRRPAENADYYEVTVKVRWQVGGRYDFVTLTSALAPSALEGAAS